MICNSENIGNVPPASFTGIQFLEVNRTPACAGCAAKAALRKAELTVCRAVFRCKAGGAENNQLSLQRFL